MVDVIVHCPVSFDCDNTHLGTQCNDSVPLHLGFDFFCNNLAHFNGGGAALSLAGWLAG